MCKPGDTVQLRVPMPAHLSHTGKFRWASKGVDRCIAPIVAALNADGIFTANCCCGHGRRRGSIVLHDGRTLIISSKPGPAPTTRKNRHA